MSERLAVSSTKVLHRVTERPYPALDFQQHAGDTACGLVVDNGGLWGWDIQGHVDPFVRRCFFCFAPDTEGEQDGF